MPQEDILVLNIRSKPEKDKRVLVCLCARVCVSVSEYVCIRESFSGVQNLLM